VTAPSRRCAAIEGGGEEHALRPLGRGVHQAADDGQEAEVRHVVGLVEHRDLDRVEEDVLAAEVVLQAAWARDQDVDAAAQGADLRPGSDPAEDRGGAQPGGLGQGGDRGMDLAGQLAGRREDQRARPA